MKYCFVISWLIILSAVLYATETVKGVVYDAKSGHPIVAANIYLQNQQQGTTSDEDGYFELDVSSVVQNEILVIEHVAYDSLHITVARALNRHKFALKPKSIQGDKIEIQADREQESRLELPVSLTIIDAKNIEGKGFVDPGDLLRTNQSVQVDEALSGSKTISIRAGNPENVLVLYDGIRMNNNYDNVFDFSRINVEDIKQVEIIKGSNTSLYGAEGLSGVINIVPRLYQKHLVRFIQKFGSYNSGDWSLQLNKSLFKKLYVSYSQRRAGSQRSYGENGLYLENKSINHSANVIYNLSGAQGDSTASSLSVLYLNNKLDYTNTRELESINTRNEIGALRFKGNIGPIDHLKLSFSIQTLNNKQSFTADSTVTSRNVANRKYAFDGRKRFDYRTLSLTLAWQYETIKLDYLNNLQLLDVDGKIRSVKFNRDKQGAVALLAFNSGKDAFADNIRLAVSYRYDNVRDNQQDQPGNSDRNWSAGMFKASVQVQKTHQNIHYNFLFNTGSNLRYPTLLNQLSAPDSNLSLSGDPFVTAQLAPEKNRSYEVGLSIGSKKVQAPQIDSWHFKVSYFNNLYENKFRNFYTPYSPFAFYDNVPNASLSGVEANAGVNFLASVLALDAGISSYNISDKAAFPLKSDLKIVANAYLELERYNLQANWFHSSEQIGWFRNGANNLQQQSIPGFSNINLYLSTEVKLWQSKLQLTLSGINLLSDATKLNGLAIHDRRYYIGLGIKY